MLEKIAPFLASIGVHKNGTWAAQKIIDFANTPEQVYTQREFIQDSECNLIIVFLFVLLDTTGQSTYCAVCSLIAVGSVWQLRCTMLSA